MVKSKNQVLLVGTISEINLKKDDNIVKKDDARIKGAITKNEFRNDALTIEVNGNSYGVDFLPTYKFKVDNGKVVENPRYKALETIMGYEKGTRVKVNASLSDGGYVDKNNEWADKITINAFQVSHTNVPEEDMCEVKLSGVIKRIAKEMVNEEETGKLNVEFLFVNNGKDGLEACPMTFQVDDDLSEDFEDYYKNGDNAVLDLELITKEFGKRNVVSENHFGRRDSKIVGGYTKTIFNLVGGDPALESENELFVSIDDMKKLLDERKIKIDASITAKKNKATSQTAPTQARGLGRSAKVDEVPFEEASADVDADPFA